MDGRGEAERGGGPRFRSRNLCGEVPVETAKMAAEAVTVRLDSNLRAAVAEGRMTMSAFMSVEVIGSR